MNKKIIGAVLLLVVMTVIMIEAFSYLVPKQPGSFNENETLKQNDFVNQPGITNVQRFTDNRSKGNANNTSGGEIVRSSIIKSTIIAGSTNSANSPLPYPRISINYTVDNVKSIGNKNSGENDTFSLVRLDIRNYGYKYFDAHPSKFRLLIRDKTFHPIVNITTGSIIDAVVPNSSRAKGDLIFLLSLKDSRANPKITYIGDYKIVYSYGIPYEGVATPTAIAEEYP